MAMYYSSDVSSTSDDIQQQLTTYNNTDDIAMWCASWMVQCVDTYW